MYYAFEFQSAAKVQGNPASEPSFIFLIFLFFSRQYYSSRSQQWQWQAVQGILALCDLAVRAAITFKWLWLAWVEGNWFSRLSLDMECFSDITGLESKTVREQESLQEEDE